jgi:tetrahydromethanopterin S-methyltransferase subunit C
VNADDMRVMIGFFFLGLGVFIIVYNLLEVYFNGPYYIICMVSLYGIVSVIVGLVLIRSYSRARRNRDGRKKVV